METSAPHLLHVLIGRLRSNHDPSARGQVHSSDPRAWCSVSAAELSRFPGSESGTGPGLSWSTLAAPVLTWARHWAVVTAKKTPLNRGPATGLGRVLFPTPDPLIYWPPVATRCHGSGSGPGGPIHCRHFPIALATPRSVNRRLDAAHPMIGIRLRGARDRNRSFLRLRHVIIRVQS